MSIEKNICALCAKENEETCCNVPAGQKLATLTFSDMERIEQTTGWLRGRFVEREVLDPMERLAYETFRPIYHGVFVGNIRFGLKAKQGKCVFLDKTKGCILFEAKPLACQLYPFDFDPLGNVTLIETSNCCLALEQAISSESLLRLFRITQKKLFKLRAQALQEGAAHARQLRRNLRHKKTCL